MIKSRLLAGVSALALAVTACSDAPDNVSENETTVVVDNNTDAANVANDVNAAETNNQ